MGYIFDLRKKVGHSPLIMTSACVVLLNEFDEILLQHRLDTDDWGLPGGSLEIGESFEEAAIRETYEESGYICKELEYLTHRSGKDMHLIYPNQDEVYIAEVVFLCRKFEGNGKIQEEEVKEQRFFQLDNLPEKLFPINKEIIFKLKELLIK